jgi:hypothetical protein
MELTRPRIIAIVLTIIGFVIAGVAGVLLATQAETLGMGGTLSGAFGAFVLAAPFLISGIYLYARHSREAQIEPESDMPQQRELMDFMLAHPDTTLAALAQSIGVTLEAARNMVQELAVLGIFTGYLTPTNELHLVNALVMEDVTHCQHCKAALDGNPPVIICVKCGAEYYRPRESGWITRRR